MNSRLAIRGLHSRAAVGPGSGPAPDQLIAVNVGDDRATRSIASSIDANHFN
jgi:hypothetical protein